MKHTYKVWPGVGFNIWEIGGERFSLPQGIAPVPIVDTDLDCMEDKYMLFTFDNRRE